jgi:hypothetical protein
MKHFLLAVFFLATQCGCLTLTTAETGRTAGEGARELTVSAASGAYADLSIGGPNDDGISQEDQEGNDPLNYVPVVEASGVVGIGDRTDLRVRANSAMFLAARVKQQLVGTPTSLFAASVGAEVGVNPGALLVGGVAYVYGTVPVYLSLHPRENVSLYAVPRYAVTNITTVAQPPSGTRSGTARWGYPGLTYGVGIGTRRRVFVEVSHLGRGAFTPSQVGVAFSTPVNWGN